MRTVLSSGVEGDFAAFDTMDRDECIERWRKQFGREPPKYVSVQFMRRALVYEAQVKAEGGLSPAVRTALERSLNDVRKSNGKAGSALPVPSQLLRPGTHLVREWNGRSYQVEVLDDGFRMDGRQYRSLTEIARKITGAHWSGPRFFGLKTS
ncbi:hypothetical protein CSC94_11555 [Zhengella mangrovi]|uniref:DUF2924 domain-containing protein n=1 Tax=Zhengella mangrovi TaxID=1982044 RepID=A0A2G1QMP5_9HYPH|nr:DUF2924 domain-containing protein [Zhengella mangrovi]PHP66741.1 hypothetical protein CSC94_11555 [Zhengella mangrovi]